MAETERSAVLVWREKDVFEGALIINVAEDIGFQLRTAATEDAYLTPELFSEFISFLRDNLVAYAGPMELVVVDEDPESEG